MNANLPQDKVHDDEPAFRIVNPDARAPLLIVCDHASNRVPSELADLGLDAAQLTQHIAWDIGAEMIARHLAEHFRARLVLATWSRLVIDLNRYPHDPASIPEASDTIPVPANHALDAGARQTRVDRYFHPYHQQIETQIEALSKVRAAPLLLSVHTMTDRLADGPARPQQINVCRTDDDRWSAPVLQTLRSDTAIVVGDNEPYAVDIGVDYTIPEHAINRGLPWLQMEFRQDLVATPEGAVAWANRFAPALERVLTEVALTDDVSLN